MIFGKKDHLVGIDIGAAFIKVAELKMSKKGSTLHKFGIAKVPDGMIQDGRIIDMEGVAEIIRSLFQSQKIKEKNVALSTGGNSVVIKTISTSKVPDEELHRNIRAEAEQYIPYDIDDVNIDYQILGDSEHSVEQMNVLLVAVRQDLVDEYVELIHMAGLNPVIIDVDAFALQNVYEILPDVDHERITLLLDVGASKTSLNILQNKNSMMMRDMTNGCDQLVAAVCERLEIDREKALQIIMGEVDYPEFEQALGDLYEMVVSNWCSDICEVVYTFESSPGNAGVENIVVSGGGGFIDLLAEKLNSELKVAVSKINPFAGLVSDSKELGELEAYQLLAPIALGLAMRRVDDK
ncbi:protein PilM [Desulfobacter hydrogenophilus]|uniref:Protein PilM n=1 Tax=Desulfobacter hydrogenophilus TaxID=2291 RepID=A0A328FH65_9BACT|nr:type IV pilus assembly protein PilM [Desulfobacter hydrogenophilus]NDY71690.1 type IV pilus assembly protein PilM [Desulfobacter hydrogenophilus]QBH13202.1 type IV pilus assembly protein PilM [Desulfobacter hydrogenophilus]RAM02377.1 protein PilM [Desulfobacter hydrogenophilus]